jgi:hypothetical protein
MTQRVRPSGAPQSSNSLVPVIEVRRPKKAG